MFQSFLKQHDATAWQEAVVALLPHIHEVDRSATQIWFHFFPLELAEAIAEPDSVEQLALTLRLDGNFRLADQVDSSHWFLYGHRYWPQVKAAIVERAESKGAPSSLELPAVIREIARGIKADESLVIGITAVGLMTLQQVELAAFRAGSGRVQPPEGLLAKSPGQIVAARKKNDSQGIVGMFRGIRAQYTVTFNETRKDARFTVDQPAAPDHRIRERQAGLFERAARDCRRTYSGAVPHGIVWDLLGRHSGRQRAPVARRSAREDADEGVRLHPLGRAEARDSARVPGPRLGQRDDRDSNLERFYREA